MLSSMLSVRNCAFSVVEDHALPAEAVCELLHEPQYVYTAATIKDGWKLYQENNPDIIFNRYQLPDGSGHALARRIRNIGLMLISLWQR